MGLKHAGTLQLRRWSKRDTIYRYRHVGGLLNANKDSDSMKKGIKTRRKTNCLNLGTSQTVPV